MPVQLSIDIIHWNIYNDLRGFYARIYIFYAIRRKKPSR